ncbi:MAG TPA: hypothetical protein VIL09_09345 [Microvirga sp.]|jgi:hypothetical protein
MQKLALILAASVIGTTAFAQDTTVIRKEGVTGSSTVVKQRSVDIEDDDEAVVTKRKVVTTGSVGCKSKTTAKTDEFGDTTVKRKTTC